MSRSQLHSQRENTNIEYEHLVHALNTGGEASDVRSADPGPRGRARPAQQPRLKVVRAQAHARPPNDATRTITLGDLVAAAYDRALRRSEDPAEVTRIATESVWRQMSRAERLRVQSMQ